MGVGSLTDHAESVNPKTKPFADVLPDEAAILRIQPHTGEIKVFAKGLRNPYDLSFDANGQLYATDNGLLTGPGDRIVAVQAGAHYGWPYWRSRGCEGCPLSAFQADDFTGFIGTAGLQPTARACTVYTGSQFPSNLFGNLFVALWNGTRMPSGRAD